ncbi:MAG: helix-turn-helix transcriptional regulator [Oceanicaulis sp.]
MKTTNTQEATASAANENQPEPFVTTEEVASFLSLTPAAIKKWRHRGDLPFPAYSVGRAIRYRLSEVQAWVLSQAHRNAPEARALKAA